jgi:hypothetical protein
MVSVTAVRAKLVALVWLSVVTEPAPSLLIVRPVMLALTSKRTFRLLRSLCVSSAFSAAGRPVGVQFAVAFHRAPAPEIGPMYVRSASALDAPAAVAIAAAAAHVITRNRRNETFRPRVLMIADMTLPSALCARSRTCTRA